MPEQRRRVDEVLQRQSGVISRSQVHAAGEAMWDIRRRLRRREWVRLLDGVYLDHTGSPTWLQQCWAGVLQLWPAALAGESAVRAVLGADWRRHDARGPIEIAVARDRHLRTPDGYRLRRTAGLDARVAWNAGPPRIRIEHAALDMAARAESELAAIAVLADICHSRRTTAVRVRDAWAERPRLRRRAWLGEVLDDIVGGTCSVLEHGYLTRIERAHGLPQGVRQLVRRTDRGQELRDVTYPEQSVVVELDGRLFHDSARARDVDLDRDLDDAAIADWVTVRLGWGQVFDRPCRTTRRLTTLLRRRGWTGAPVRCGSGCGAT